MKTLILKRGTRIALGAAGVGAARPGITADARYDAPTSIAGLRVHGEHVCRRLATGEIGFKIVVQRIAMR